MSKTIMPLKKKLERRGVSVTAEDLKQLRQNGTPIYPKIKIPTIEVQLTPKEGSEKELEGWLGEGEFDLLKAGETRLKATLDLGGPGRVTFLVTDLSNVVMGNLQVVGGLLIMPDGEGRYGDVTIMDDGHVDVRVDDTPKTTEVVPSPEHHTPGNDLGCLKINGTAWNIPMQEIVCSGDKFEARPTTRSIIINGTPWNMPDYDEALEEKADKTALNTLADTVQTKEDRSNKVNEWQATPDHQHYPTEKLVKDAIQAITPKVRTVRTNTLYTKDKPATGELSIRVSDNNISITGELELNEGFTELIPQQFVFRIKCDENIPSAGDKIKIVSSMTGDNKWYISNSYFETIELAGEEYWKITITVVRYDTTASETDPPKVQFIGIGILD